MIFFLVTTEQQHFFFLSTANDSSSSSSPSDSGRADAPVYASRPSIAVVIGVLSTMFSITFLLLIYAKHCRRAPLPSLVQSGITRPSSSAASSGIDPLIISALPMFSFSSLKGHKGGLECAVCLYSYQEADVLRLLPSCKHAFHVECVDKWLLARSTCPLCRTQVSPDDTLLIDAAASRLSISNSNLVEEQLLEDPISARFHVQVQDLEENISSSNAVLVPSSSSSSSSSGDLILRRLSHRIIITDVMFQQRWSDLVPADVLFLNASRINGPNNNNHANARMPLSSPDSNTKARLSASCLHKGSSSSPQHHNSAAEQLQQQQLLLLQLSENKNTGAANAKKPPSSSFLKRALSVDQCSGRSIADLSSHLNGDKTLRWLSIARVTLNWLMGRSHAAAPQFPAVLQSSLGSHLPAVDRKLELC